MRAVRKTHDLADLLVELHAHGLGTSSKRAGFGLEQEMREDQYLAGEGSEAAHHHGKVAGAQRAAVVVITPVASRVVARPVADCCVLCCRYGYCYGYVGLASQGKANTMANRPRQRA